MYIIINSVNYTDLRNLTFTPEIDVIGDAIPINEFNVEIKTSTEISVGQFAYLYDDLDQLWAKFWIIFADTVDEGFVQIKAQSPICLLDRGPLLPAVIYTNATGIQTALTPVFARLSGISSYGIDPNLINKSVKGYCPEQTPRERLQWICYVAGAYIKQSFTDKIEVKELDTQTVVDIPIEKTYWKPQIEYSDYVTAINLTTYTFTAGTPTGDDEYVEVNGAKYIITKTVTQLINTSAPETAAQNEITVDGIYLANSDNSSEILSRLALIYFSRRKAKADIINNREFQPSDKVTVQLDDERQAVGYIQSMDFSFGVQAKSSIEMMVSVIKELTRLIINYLNDGVVIAKKRYSFPEGYTYRIENDFIDQSNGGHKYVYRPINEYATGTIVAGTNTNNQNVAIALHQFISDKLLYVVSVSDIEYDSDEKVLKIG